MNKYLKRNNIVIKLLFNKIISFIFAKEGNRLFNYDALAIKIYIYFFFAVRKYYVISEGKEWMIIKEGSRK